MHFHETIFQLSSCSIWYMMKYYVWFLQKKKKEKRKLLLCKVDSRPSSPKAMSLYGRTLTRTVKSRDFREDALIIMETLKQRRQRRLRKCLLKSEVALLQTLQHLFHLVQFVKCWQFFQSFEFWKTVTKFKKRVRKSLSCVFTSSSKREIRHFHVVVV